MKIFKYTSYGRVNVIVLDKVVKVHMSESTGWIYLIGIEQTVEVDRSITERLIKTMEE